MKASKEANRAARKLLRLSFVDGKIDMDRVAKSAKVIKDEKPRDYIQILDTYLHLLRMEADKKHAIVESASALPEADGKEIENNLKRKYGDDLTAEFTVNPDLIGGLRVRVGSDVWDGSVKARLQNLSNKF